jgi:hypothetical protein
MAKNLLRSIGQEHVSKLLVEAAEEIDRLEASKPREASTPPIAGKGERRGTR